MNEEKANKTDSNAERKIDAEWLDNLARLYSSPCDFSVANLSLYYRDDARFSDPVHEVIGLPAMQAYFTRAYASLTHCRFDFTGHAQNGNSLFISWQMHFSHPRLRQGVEIVVPGCSKLELQAGKIRAHRDYYDVGNLLYDNIPLLGSVTAYLKRKLVP
jgi:limonene-1,2-epoxide hydrolase